MTYNHHGSIFEVEYTVHPAQIQTLETQGFPEHVEVISVLDEDGNEVEYLFSKDYREIERAAWKHYQLAKNDY